MMLTPWRLPGFCRVDPNLLICPSTLQIDLFFYASKAAASVPWSFCWVAKACKHGLPSSGALLYSKLIAAISAPIAPLSISSPAATGWWDHNPQIYSTRALGQALIPNPWISSPGCSISCGAEQREAPGTDGNVAAKPQRQTRPIDSPREWN